MKVFIIYLVIGFISLTLQTTLFQSLPFPDIPLIMTFYLGFHGNPTRGVITSFSLGYLADAFSSGILGITSFSLISIFIIVYLLAKRLAFNPPLVRIGGVVFISLLKGGIVYILITGLTSKPGVPLFSVILPIAILTGMVSPIIFNILDRATSLERGWP